MPLLQSLLRATNFRSPLLRTIVPGVAAAFAIQTAFAVPSVALQSELFYDISGSLTYLGVTYLSLYLPALRARSAGGLTNATKPPLPGLLEPFTSPATAGLNWRQVVLSGAVTIWTARLGSYLFQRILADGSDSRFDEMKKSPPQFFGAWMVQAVWVSLCLMPVMAVNSIPVSAFASIPGIRVIDALGLAIFVGGLSLEAAADRQKSRWKAQKHAKQHDEEFITSGLWSKSRYPNYFGESTLWTGIATLAAGTLVAMPIQSALGLSGTLTAQLGAAGLAYLSPAFTTLILLKLSGVPMSEKKYDKRYGDRKDYQEWKKNTPKFFPKLS